MAMTPTEFFDAMIEIDKSGDTESRHGKADNLLCLVLRQLGYNEGVRVFETMNKWYA